MTQCITKLCTKCKVDKSALEFFRDKRSKTGLDHWCKTCRSEYNSNNRDKRRDRNLRNCYGVSLKEYEEILKLQNGACAICNAESSQDGGPFHVDHCHKSDKVRGLLCNNCNTSLGLLYESTSTLRKMIDYIDSDGFIDL